MRLLLTLLLLCLTPQLHADSFPRLTLLSEEYAPISYQKNGRAAGFAVDVLMATLRELKSQQSLNDVQILPWARAYEIATIRKNTLLFATTYTEHRANLFHWVGPLFPAPTVVLAKKSSQIKIQHPGELDKYLLGAVRSDAGEQLLFELGVKHNQIFSNANPNYVLNMLIKDRIQGVAYTQVTANYYLEKLGQAPEQFEPIFTLHHSEEYFAFSKRTPRWIVDRFYQAYLQVKQSPEYDRILSQYPSVDLAIQSAQN